MENQDKQLKLSVVVEEASFRKAVNELRALTQEIQRTIDASTRLISGMAGYAQGGSPGGNAGMAAILGSAAPTPQSAVQSSAPGSTTQVKAPQGLTDTASTVRNLIREATDGTNNALRSAGDNLKAFSSTAVRELQKIAAEQSKVNSGWDVIDDLVKQNAGFRGGSGGANTVSAGDLVNGNGAQGIGVLQATQNKPWWQRAKEFGGQEVSGNILSAGGMARFMGGYGGLGLLAGGMAMGAYNGIVGTSQAVDTANAGHYFNEIMQPGRVAAAQGQMRGLADSVRQGNLGLARATLQTLNTPEFRRLSSSNAAINSTDMALQESGYGLTTGALGSRAMESILTAGGGAEFGRQGLSTNQIKLNERLANLPVEMMGEMQEQISNRMASDPRWNRMADTLMAGASGNLGFQRQIAMGGRANLAGITGPWDMNKPFGAGTLAPWQEYQLRSLNMGYESEAMAALGGQIQQAAGRRFAGREFGLMGATVGGFSNAASVFGIGAQYGGAGRLFSAAQSIMGGGGLDVTAGNRMAGGVAGMIANAGDFTGSGGAALMQGLGSAAFTGTPGGDLYMTNVLTKGMKAYGQSHSGLESGVSHITAMEVSGGDYNVATALERMSPEMRVAISRSGDAGVFGQLGITADMVRKFENRSSMLFADFIPNGDNRLTNKVRKFQQSGLSVGDFIKSQVPKGISLSSNAGRKLIRNEAESLGMAYSLAHDGVSFEDAFGMILARSSGDKNLIGSLRAGGASDVVSPKDINRAVLQARSQAAREGHEFTVKEETDLRAALAARGSVAEGLDNLAANTPKTIYNNAAQALEEAAKRLRVIGMSNSYNSGIESAKKNAQVLGSKK